MQSIESGDTSLAMTCHLIDYTQGLAKNSQQTPCRSQRLKHMAHLHACSGVGLNRVTRRSGTPFGAILASKWQTNPNLIGLLCKLPMYDVDQ